MATNSVYSIGQYRSGKTQSDYLRDLFEYVDDVDTETLFIQTPSATTNNKATEEALFRDKALVLTGGYGTGNFSKNKTYFLRLKIPRNVAHNITYDIKMVNLVTTIPDSASDVAKNNIKYFYDENATYQHLKRVTVMKGSEENGALIKKIVVGKLSNAKNENDNIVASIINSSYSTIKESGSNFSYIDNEGKSHLIEKSMELTVDISELVREMSEEEQNYEIVEILFKPLNDNCNGIVVEKVRETLDYNTQFTENGVVYYGLYTDVIGMELYEINNLLGNKIPHKPLSKIGVWSHSGLCLSINGEEIRVGARGYYEVDIEDFDISELGVVVEDPDFDKFLIDYEYRVSE